jgi:hypothetical protein
MHNAPSPIVELIICGLTSQPRRRRNAKPGAETRNSGKLFRKILAEFRAGNG